MTAQRTLDADGPRRIRLDAVRQVVVRRSEFDDQTELGPDQERGSERNVERAREECV